MEFEAVAKHARAVERLRILLESIDAVLELMPKPADDPGAQLALRLLERERASLEKAIDALE